MRTIWKTLPALGLALACAGEPPALDDLATEAPVTCEQVLEAAYHDFHHAVTAAVAATDSDSAGELPPRDPAGADPGPWQTTCEDPENDPECAESGSGFDPDPGEGTESFERDVVGDPARAAAAARLHQVVMEGDPDGAVFRTWLEEGQRAAALACLAMPYGSTSIPGTEAEYPTDLPDDEQSCGQDDGGDDGSDDDGSDDDDGPPTEDAGPGDGPDGGSRDAGSPDAGSPDAGPRPDAGPMPDAGPPGMPPESRYNCQVVVNPRMRGNTNLAEARAGRYRWDGDILRPKRLFDAYRRQLLLGNLPSIHYHFLLDADGGMPSSVEPGPGGDTESVCAPVDAQGRCVNNLTVRHTMGFTPMVEIVPRWVWHEFISPGDGRRHGYWRDNDALVPTFTRTIDGQARTFGALCPPSITVQTSFFPHLQIDAHAFAFVKRMYGPMYVGGQWGKPTNHYTRGRGDQYATAQATLSCFGPGTAVADDGAFTVVPANTGPIELKAQVSRSCDNSRSRSVSRSGGMKVGARPGPRGVTPTIGMAASHTTGAADQSGCTDEHDQLVSGSASCDLYSSYGAQQWSLELGGAYFAPVERPAGPPEPRRHILRFGPPGRAFNLQDGVELGFELSGPYLEVKSAVEAQGNAGEVAINRYEAYAGIRLGGHGEPPFAAIRDSVADAERRLSRDAKLAHKNTRFEFESGGCLVLRGSGENAVADTEVPCSFVGGIDPAPFGFIAPDRALDLRTTRVYRYRDLPPARAGQAGLTYGQL